ncbi:GNAT family N-acetyltransferase [Arthrobacter sp. CDRTa11]|uniref:GNAT family N-acetyltransferase n=1 Tax=Arthrobacter sp. CDRTa11 TaxID=2651199 RepID=UPI002265DE66|nr:GNAT family N-acetyltransferase [Arthrobacter sp. CDRTa11]UZX03717.1 GNAT family N-acetyltransferase [Arthrobacter sp. CDRTa11]
MTDSNEAPRIRPAEPADLGCLPQLEAAADAQLQDALGGVLLPAPQPTPALGSLFVLVSGRPPAGFARVDVVDGLAHLEQLSVHPAAGRRGLGRALVEAAADEARRRGFKAMTLCTFADVPFNAPFYARCGFVEFPASGPGLAALRAHEKRLGLDALAPRLTMRREL